MSATQQSGRKSAGIAPQVVHVVGAGVALAMGAAFVLGVLAPVQARQAVAHADRARLDQTRVELESAGRKIEATRTHIDSLRQQLDDSVQLQPAENVNRVVKQLTDAALETGLRVLDVTPGERIRESKDYAVVPIRLTASGTFAQTLAFLHTSNSRFRDMATRAMSVRKQDGGAGVDVIVELAWFTLAGDANAPDARTGRAGRDDSRGDDSR